MSDAMEALPICGWGLIGIVTGRERLRAMWEWGGGWGKRILNLGWW